MKFDLQLSVADKDKSLYECFKPEASKKDRSSLTINHKNSQLLFDIKAKDVIALKASINGIIKLLEVKEKVDKNE